MTQVCAFAVLLRAPRDGMCKMGSDKPYLGGHRVQHFGWRQHIPPKRRYLPTRPPGARTLEDYNLNNPCCENQKSDR
jgi:hypothetical protein